MGQTASAHLNGTGTQLIKASKSGDVDAVMELVSSHPQLLHYSNFRQFGPCHYAARGNHVEMLQQLIAKAEEVQQLMQQESSRKQLQQQQQRASNTGPGQQGMPSLVQQLVNASSDRGITPLMLAVDEGCVESVKLLLDKGADPWAVDKLGGRTPLHYAARKDNPDVLQLLIEAAGSTGSVNFPNRPNTRYVDVRTQTGFTAVHFAVQFNNQQSLAVLLNAGANLLLSSLFDCLDTINCPKGTTALHLAAKSGNVAVGKQLLKAYMELWYHRHLPDPRLLMDGDSQLPCQVAARRQHVDIARMLLPSTPLTSLFADGDLTLLGPPTLAAIAGAVLRGTLTGDLSQLMQQEQQQQESTAEEAQPQAAAAADASVDDVDESLPAAAAAAPGDQQAAAAAVVVMDDDSAHRHDGCAQHTCHSCKAASPASTSGGPAAVVQQPGASAHACAGTACAGTSDGEVCGVCFDVPTQVVLVPCQHELCINCCQHLLALNSRCVMMCPFCRAGVAHLLPVAGTPAAASAEATPAVAAPLMVPAAMQFATAAAVMV